MTRPLYLDRDAIVSTVRGSTADRAAETADFLDRALRAWAGRAGAGPASAQQREQAVRDRIIAAAGALPALVPEFVNWPAAVQSRIQRNPTRWGFDATPDRATIRKAHAYVLANSVPSSDPKASGVPTILSSTLRST